MPSGLKSIVEAPDLLPPELDLHRMAVANNMDNPLGSRK